MLHIARYSTTCLFVCIIGGTPRRIEESLPVFNINIRTRITRAPAFVWPYCSRLLRPTTSPLAAESSRESDADADALLARALWESFADDREVRHSTRRCLCAHRVCTSCAHRADIRIATRNSSFQCWVSGINHHGARRYHVISPGCVGDYQGPGFQANSGRFRVAAPSDISVDDVPRAPSYAHSTKYQFSPVPTLFGYRYSSVLDLLGRLDTPKRTS